MATISRLAERPEGGWRYELRDGEVVEVPIPAPWQVKLTHRIEGLLRPLAAADGVVRANWPYRPLPNLQVLGRWNRTRPSHRLGFPASRRVAGLHATADRRNTGGAEEFWIVSRAKRTVEISRLDGVRVYSAGETIGLSLFHGCIEAADIFA